MDLALIRVKSETEVIKIDLCAVNSSGSSTFWACVVQSLTLVVVETSVYGNELALSSLCVQLHMLCLFVFCYATFTPYSSSVGETES